MTEKEAVHEMLRSALDADEQGRKEEAIELYSNAVEMILKVSDPTLREKLNKYAVNALERAEELRGISPTHRPRVDNAPKAVSPRNDISHIQGI